MRRLAGRLLRLVAAAVVLALALRRPAAPFGDGLERGQDGTAGATPSGPRDERSRRFRLGAIAGALGLAALLGLGGALVAVSGVVPLKASSGHWAITAWLLDFSKRRSVATHTLGMEAPDDLADRALVARGAGHYEIGCRACHGSPDLPRPLVVRRMLPSPPYLPDTIGRYEPVELFYIVKHGLKFTGMPAWPVATRDDEVWAMVAFLRALPALGADGYDRLARGAAAQPEAEARLDSLQPNQRGAPAAVVENCARCHGEDGRGREPGAFPTIAGQRPEYLSRSLAAFASGDRSSGIMASAIAGLRGDVLREVVAHYASRPGLSSAGPESGAGGTGRVIATRGVPERNVPACVKCHTSDEGPRNPVYPELGGQDARYLVLQLQLFQAGVRGGTEYAHVMQRVANGLTEEEMLEVARYFSQMRLEAH